MPVGRYITIGGNLTLMSIVESDRGIFECSATNEAATVTADTELMIENVAPRPPSNLTATNVTEHSITIRWQPGKCSEYEYFVCNAAMILIPFQFNSNLMKYFLCSEWFPYFWFFFLLLSISLVSILQILFIWNNVLIGLNKFNILLGFQVSSGIFVFNLKCLILKFAGML